MNKPRQYFTLIEICEHTGLSHETVCTYIEREWITPTPSVSTHDQKLDHEDLARIELILELQNNLGVNDDAIPVILHLLDQIHYLRHQISKTINS